MHKDLNIQNTTYTRQDGIIAVPKDLPAEAEANHHQIGKSISDIDGIKIIVEVVVAQEIIDVIKLKIRQLEILEETPLKTKSGHSRLAVLQGA